MAQLHVYGGEFDTRHQVGEISKPSDVTVGLYSDSEDSLDKYSDEADIESEPDGSDYSRQTVSFDTSEMSTEQDDNDDWRVVIDPVVFNTEDATSSVDSYFVLVEFESVTAGDSDGQEHIYYTGALDQEYDLGQISEFTLDPSGYTLT